MALLHDYLEKNGLAECEVSIFFLTLKLKTSQKEKSAAWSLFVQLTTRVTTQKLEESSGIEKAALDSLYEFFKISRDLLAENGRLAEDFSVLTVFALNKILRPFLSKWHRKSEQDKCFESIKECENFRRELKELQKELISLSYCLADTAGLKPELAVKLI